MSNRKRRLKLLAEDDRCWWCKCTVVELGDSFVGHPPAYMATLDHIYSKFDPRRHEPSNGERRQVLACYECNQRRRNEPRLGTNAGVTISNDPSNTTSP